MPRPTDHRTRRLLRRASAPLLALLLAGTLGAPAAAHAPAADTVVAPDLLHGLRVASRGACTGGYRIEGTDLCTHGPDARPAGRRAPVQPRSISATIESPLPEAVLCDGDGRSGKRVQAISARLAGTPSRRSTVLPLIRTAAAGVQSAFLASAARTDGVRRPRWVTGPDCSLAIEEVELSEAARRSFNTTITELAQAGHARTDRKYLIWFDTSIYCGIGTFWGDDRPTADNLSETRVGYARVDAGCWGWAEAHELMHNLGAVQNTAPHTTAGIAPGAFAHCTDEYDLMCYADASGVTLTVVCPDRGLDGQFDCGNDDYFHTDPPPGSYLASHWNAADSGWLERSVASLRSPRPSLVVGSTVDASRVPVRVAVATRAPLAGLESIDAQRRLGDTAWQDATSEGAPVTIRSTLPLDMSARFRTRIRDGADAPGPWRVGPAVTARLRDQDHRTLDWSRGWRTVADAGPGTIGGTLQRGRRAGASVSLRTDASQVGIVATRGPRAGRLELRVDGRQVRIVDLAATTTVKRTIVATIDLGAGNHTLEVRVKAPRTATPGWRVDVDAVVLLDR